METLATYIKGLRIKRGMTLDQAGDRLGMRKQTLWGYELDKENRTRPSLEKLIKMTQLYEGNLDKMVRLLAVEDPEKAQKYRIIIKYLRNHN